MGYRSDVAMTIRFKGEDGGKKLFYLFLAAAKADPKTAAAFVPLELDINGVWLPEINEEKYQINFSIDGVTWNESYPEVDAIIALHDLAKKWTEMDMLATGEPNDTEMGVRFVRVGESADDIEEEEEGALELFCALDVVTVIERDW